MFIDINKHDQKKCAARSHTNAENKTPHCLQHHTLQTVRLYDMRDYTNERRQTYRLQKE